MFINFQALFRYPSLILVGQEALYKVLFSEKKLCFMLTYQYAESDVCTYLRGFKTDACTYIRGFNQALVVSTS